MPYCWATPLKPNGRKMRWTKARYTPTFRASEYKKPLRLDAISYTEAEAIFIDPEFYRKD